MRRQYDFSKAARGNPYAARVRRTRAHGGADDVPPLTRRQMREIERRVRDSEDRTRFLLASLVTPRFILYYNLSDDNYAMNEPEHATLFKRRNAASAIQQLVGGRVKIVRCRVNKRGQLVLRSLPDPFPKRRARSTRARQEVSSNPVQRRDQPARSSRGPARR